MTRLSVNINKIATLRNARGGNMPDVTRAALDCEAFGAQGITVHRTRGTSGAPTSGRYGLCCTRNST